MALTKEIIESKIALLMEARNTIVDKIMVLNEKLTEIDDKLKFADNLIESLEGDPNLNPPAIS